MQVNSNIPDTVYRKALALPQKPEKKKKDESPKVEAPPIQIEESPSPRWKWITAVALVALAGLSIDTPSKQPLLIGYVPQLDVSDSRAFNSQFSPVYPIAEWHSPEFYPRAINVLQSAGCFQFTLPVKTYVESFFSTVRSSVYPNQSETSSEGLQNKISKTALKLWDLTSVRAPWYQRLLSLPFQYPTTTALLASATAYYKYIPKTSKPFELPKARLAITTTAAQSAYQHALLKVFQDKFESLKENFPIEFKQSVDAWVKNQLENGNSSDILPKMTQLMDAISNYITSAASEVDGLDSTSLVQEWLRLKLKYQATLEDMLETVPKHVGQ